MIEAFVAGEAVAFRLPNDEDNPTIWHAVPINDKQAKRWQYLREYAEKKAAEAHRADSVEKVLSTADSATDQERAFLASLVVKIENAPPDGKTITDQAEIRTLIGGLQAQPYALLIACLNGGHRLADLTFRRDPVSGDAEREEQGGSGGSEGGA